MPRSRAKWLLPAAGFLLLAALAAFVSPAQAWTSPGGGNSYTMTTLDVAAMGDVDPLVGTCHYRIQQTVTISAGDTLAVDAGCWLEFDNNRNLTIAGALYINGTAASGVLFDSNAGVPAQGGWGGITFAGSGAQPSRIDNLTMQWSTSGVRCLSCQNLTVDNFYVELNTDDGVLLLDQASGILLYNITQKVTLYNSQSVVGAHGASRITGSAVNGTGSATLLKLWNVTNSSFAGPNIGLGLVIAAAWIDNATNVSVAGLGGGLYPTGFRVTRSAGVTLTDIAFTSASAWGVDATGVNAFTITNFTMTAGTGGGLLLNNASNASLQALSLTTLLNGLYVLNSRSVAVANSSATALSPPLFINRSSTVWVNDSNFLGGSLASVLVNGSSNVSFAAVRAPSAANGFVVQSSTSVALTGCTASSTLGDGVQVLASSAVTLNASTATGNARRGAWISSSMSVSLLSSNLSGNVAEGVFASASSLQVVDTAIAQNALDGFVLTNGSVFNATGVSLVSNGREGLWVIGSNGTLAGASVRLNGANGTRAEGATLNITDGVFENNTLHGVYFETNASGAWTVFSSALLSSNPAVLGGSLTAAAGGQITVLNATVSLRGTGGFPYLIAVAGAATLWLDGAVLQNATPGARYAVGLSGGSTFTALRSGLSNAGTGSLPAVDAASSLLTFSAVSLSEPYNSLLLRAQSTASLSDVSVTGARGAAVVVQTGALLVATRLTVDAPAAEALVADAALVSVQDSTFSNAAADLIRISGSDLAVTNVSLLNGSAHGVNATAGSRVTAVQLRIKGIALDAVSIDTGAAANLSFFAASQFGNAGLHGAGGSSFVVSNVTLTGGAFGAWLDGANLTGADFASDGAASDSLWLSGGASADLTRAVLSNASGHALQASSAGNISLRSSALSAPFGASVDHANSFTLVSVSVDALGTGFDIGYAAAVTFTDVRIASGGPSLGVQYSFAVNVTGLNATGGGIVFDNCTGVSVADSSVRISLPSEFAVRLAASPDASLSNLTIDASAAIVGVELLNLTSPMVRTLSVAGGGFGVSLDIATGVTLYALLVDGSFVGLRALGGSSANFSSATLRNLTNTGVLSEANSSVDLWGSSITAAPLVPGFVAVNSTGGAAVRLFDTVVTNSSFASSTFGRIEVWWSLRVLVLFAGAPYAGAQVSVGDRSRAPAWTQSTDATGSTAAHMTLEFFDLSGFRSYSSPIVANATLAGGFAGSASFDLDRPKNVTITLLDVQAPNLEVRANLRTTRGVALAFLPDLGDKDNVGIVSYEWSFLNETGALVRLTGTSAAYTFSQAGRYAITVAAFDALGNRGSTTFEVWVNAPPFFVNPPGPGDLIGIEERLFTRTFSAFDNDTSDIPLLAFSVDGPAGVAMSGGTLSWTPALHGIYSLTVYVTDGFDRVGYSFDLLIGSDTAGNRPPEFTSEPVRNASVLYPYLYAVKAQDPDLGDTIVIQLVSGPAGMSFQQNGILPTGDLTWIPGSYYPRGVDAYNWTFNISLRAFDGRAFGYQNFTILLRNPPDEAPEIIALENLTLSPGEVLSLDLRQFVRDLDDPLGPFTWSIVKPDDTAGASIGFEASNATTLTVRAPDRIEGTKSFFVTFKVSDSSGKTATKLVKVELHGPTTAEAAFPWILLLILVGGVGAAFALATRQRAGLAADEAAASPPGGSGGGSSAQTAVPASDAGFPVYLEGAVLFDQSDTIIATATVEGASLEDAFVLTPSKAREQPLPDGVITVASVEGRDVALLREGDSVLGALGKFAGEPSPWLLDPMKGVIAQVQARAREVNAVSLEKVGADPGVAEALRGLLAVSAGASAAAVAKYARESSLRVASVVEHVQGYLRLKIAVDNNSGQLAADVRLSVEHDDKVLRLERIEPSVDRKRDRMQLGNLRPGERKTFAFYFDPQICTRSFFNATVAWEDARGGFHSTAMRTRSAEVVCPAFSTPKSANTAMLKRLLQEELAYRDSKYFRFPELTSAEQVFEACKQSVLAQDVRLVKEFVTSRPYRAEAWFYGETKVKQSPMVVWTAVFGAERVAQFSVASNAHASITGLLAELGRRLVDSRAGGGVGAPIETMGKAAAAASVGDRPTLLSKSQQGELASGEGRAP